MRKREFAVVLGAASLFSCVPLNPSAQSIAGIWTLKDSHCGVQTLTLDVNGSYAYTFNAISGRQSSVTGKWRLVPAASWDEGARLVLSDAPKFCDDREAPGIGLRERGDRALGVVWEWGHTEISFHPDLAGFTRSRE